MCIGLQGWREVKIMSELSSLLNSFLSVASLVLALFIIPFAKFVFDLRLKIERIEVILNIILKDVEQLKKEVYRDENCEN